MAGKKWTDSTIPQATEIGSTDQFLIVQNGVSKRITQSVMQSSSGNNVKTVAYTVGVYGVTGVDYNFASAANTTIQSIQLGGSAIIPAKALINNIVIWCEVGLNGAITGTGDTGNTSGGSEYGASRNVDDTNEIVAEVDSTAAFYSQVSASASSVYWSFTPSANWNTITTGSWKIWITYIDNSII